MRKVVINTCYGGFSLSREAFELYCQKAGLKDQYYDGGRGIYRDDTALVEAVEELGVEKASGDHARLKIVEIPDDVEWHIYEYDGNECVAENHRTWS